MLKNRLFFIVVAVSLLVMAAIVINQTVATAKVVGAGSSQAVTATNKTLTAPCPFSAEDQRSMHAVYVKEIGVWLTRTDRGYTGPDGGALSLLNCPPLDKK